jgi:hypothetical protein
MNDSVWPGPLRAPVEGPSAWIGADLRTRPETWTYRLTQSDIAEIQAATAGVIARGIDIAEVTRDSFPLPTFAAVLAGHREALLHGRGFVLLRGLPVDAKPMRESAISFCGIGSHIGTFRSQNAKGHLLGHVRNLGGPPASVDPTVRAYATAERQTFHTDGCDVVGLLCLKPAKSGGLSSIVSSMTMYNRMAASRPDLASRLFAPMPFDRRGETPEGALPFYIMPVLTDYAGRLTCSYLRRNINSSQRHPDAPRLTPDDLAALDMWDDLANDGGLRLDIVLEPGDIQFVYNHTTLHDRTAFEDWPEEDRKRHLLRLWLCVPGDRPLDPVLAQRFGSVEIGNRSGIICKGTRLHAPLVPS